MNYKGRGGSITFFGSSGNEGSSPKYRITAIATNSSLEDRAYTNKFHSNNANSNMAPTRPVTEDGVAMLTGSDSAAALAAILKKKTGNGNNHA